MDTQIKMARIVSRNVIWVKYKNPRLKQKSVWAICDNVKNLNSSTARTSFVSCPSIARASPAIFLLKRPGWPSLNQHCDLKCGCAKPPHGWKHIQPRFCNAEARRGREYGAKILNTITPLDIPCSVKQFSQYSSRYTHEQNASSRLPRTLPSQTRNPASSSAPSPGRYHRQGEIFGRMWQVKSHLPEILSDFSCV